MQLSDAINPCPEWSGVTWVAGHFWSGREPSSRIYDPAHNGRVHNGWDVAAPMGSPLVSPLAGVVAEIGYNSGAGNYVVTRSVIANRNLYPRHLHIQTGSIIVEVGQEVAQGERLASVGSTGASAGPHDHIEMAWDKPRQPWWAHLNLDPEYWITGSSPGYYDLVNGGEVEAVIMAIQETLTAAGYDPGPIDGILGNRTKAAMVQRNKDAKTGGGVPSGEYPATITFP